MSEQVSGSVTRILFRNAQNGYTALKLQPDEASALLATDGSISITGSLPGIDVGDRITVSGVWVEHPRYGLQFNAESVVRRSGGGSSAPAGETVISGTVGRITYFNEENGYSVVKIEPAEDYPDAATYDGLVTVTGIMPELVEGESAEFTGRWVDNPQYGRQFKAEKIVPVPPSTQQGIVRYLADTVHGVGEVTAKRIYEHFGKDTLSILDKDPDRIREVPGLKTQLVHNFLSAWQSNRAERQVMIHLQDYGLTSGLARKIYTEYGAATLTIVQADPYQLADDIRGIGFKKADQIARGIGIASNSRQRLRAGLVYTLNQLSNDGHTYAPQEFLLETAQELLGLTPEDEDDLRAVMQEQVLADNLRAERLVLADGQTVEAVYLPLFHGAEQSAARRLRTLAQTPSHIQYGLRETDWESYLEALAASNDVELTPIQQGAVRAALTSKVSVLTGGPGTGKTTTLRMVINALEQEGVVFRLASPTGRAAKRLQEATGHEAQTIHRLLEFSAQEGGFTRDDDYPLDCEMVIIDEASMLDLLLFHSLLKALRETTHLMLVGDIDQLPSVGAGNVLNDVIQSGVAYVTRLNEIFRQSSGSHIILNAHRINQGDQPLLDNTADDFFFFNMDDPPTVAEMIVDIVVNRVPEKFGVHPINEVQVIAPMYRGAIGVDALNQALQRALNGSKGIEEKRINGVLYRKGDKVMQTRNNYDKDVFNGDIGRIYGFDSDENTIHVMIDERPIIYTQDEAEDLRLAYCISTHRSQGSEYPVVVMPVMMQHYMMLQRNLLYTAITRARQVVVLVGTRKAVAMAVRNNKVAERYSGLLPRLIG